MSFTRPRFTWPLIVALWSQLVAASGAMAQGVRGRVVDPGGSPSVGALVELIDSTDAVQARVLSNSAGGFSLGAPHPGTYRVRVLRIGFRPTTSASLVLMDREWRELEMTVGRTPVVLNAMTVSERRICQLEEKSGGHVADAWGEALKALAASEITRASSGYMVRLALFERRLDRAGRVLSQHQTERSGSGYKPFASTAPESLATHGYVTTEGAVSTYYGPDAEVLQSRAFAASHCLRMVSGAKQGKSGRWIGLAFEPVDDDRPEIKGVLWLDEQTNELREVEYRYVGLNPDIMSAEPGGRVSFQRLPGGGWIVSRWSITMPITRTVRGSGTPASGTRLSTGALLHGRLRLDVAGLQESGGEVLTVQAHGDTLWTGRISGIRGSVANEAGSSIAGAILRVQGTDRRVLSDSQGSFSFGSLLPGRYEMAVETVESRALGLPAVLRSVVVPDSGFAVTAVIVPSLRTAIEGICGDGSVSKSIGLLRVLVSDSATGLPVADAQVQGVWLQKVVQQQTYTAAVTTRRTAQQVSPGAYWMCAVAKDRPVEIKVVREGRTTTANARVPADSMHADVRVTVGRHR